MKLKQTKAEKEKKRGFLSRLMGVLKDGTNYFIVFLLIVIIALWMGSHQAPSSPSADTTARSNANTKNVLVQQFPQQETERNIRISGYTQEERMVEIKAELNAQVVRIAIEEGQEVKKTTHLMSLEQDEAAARLQQAKAQEKQALIELESEKKLRTGGLSSASAEARAIANYETAKTALTLAQKDYEATKIVAPFAGHIEKIHIEEGDYVQTGQLLAAIVDYQPMLVIGALSELEVAYVTEGTPATISLVTGEILTGVVRRLATQANKESRTFDVEIEVPNQEKNLRSGVTAEIDFHTGTISATQISASLLSLDDQGRLGVKAVNQEDGRVSFIPIEVVKAETNEMWVTGIAEDIQVIVRGHGFVEEGEEVTTSSNQESG